jgi:hypothetical protein
VCLTPHFARVHDLHPGFFFPLLSHSLTIFFYNNVLHLIVSWLEYQLLSQDMCFWIQVWGYDMPTSTHSGTPIPLTFFFQFCSFGGMGDTFTHTCPVFEEKNCIFMLSLNFWLT